MWWWLAGCFYLLDEVHTECAPLRLSTGRPECDGIELCVQTRRPRFAGAAATTSRSWFVTAEGETIEIREYRRCATCDEPPLQDLVCANQSLSSLFERRL
jgi:hypothetical protein